MRICPKLSSSAGSVQCSILRIARVSIRADSEPCHASLLHKWKRLYMDQSFLHSVDAKHSVSRNIDRRMSNLGGGGGGGGGIYLVVGKRNRLKTNEPLIGLPVHAGRGWLSGARAVLFFLGSNYCH